MSKTAKPKTKRLTDDATEATASMFVTAFQALPSKTRDRVLQKLIESEDLRDHIEGALLWEERKNGEYVSFRDYLKQRSSAT